MNRRLMGRSHAFILSLTWLLAWNTFAVAQTNRTSVSISVLQPSAATIKAATVADVQKTYDEWRATAAPNAHVPREVMLQMYQKGDYKTLKTMIENGKISGDHSLSMADVRTAMCIETIGEICKQNGWKVYRSDSGNQLAGMTSDIDQTLYVYAKDEKTGQWRRVPEFDAEMLKQFQTHFEQKYQITLDKFDIATIAGKDKFPDPRLISVQLDTEAKGTFKMKAGETMVSLRMTPGAYTYCGAVVQQMQLRALGLIEKELSAGRPQNSGKPRRVNPELEKLVSDPGSRVLDEISADDKGAAHARQATDDEAVGVMFDGLKPDLQRGHAYDAAVANYLEFMHHLKDKNPAVKYHLRAADDGLHMLEFLNGATQSKVQYENLTDTGRREYLERAVGKSQPQMVERWKRTFDISAKLRELHNAKALNDKNVNDAFKPLAEEVAGSDKANWEKYLPQARKEYNRRCEEFLVHNIVQTSQERVLLWINHDPANPEKGVTMDKLVDEDRVRKALNLDGAENAAKWIETKGKVYQNYADLARLQLLYSFREMDPKIADAVIENAKAKGISEVDLKALIKLKTEAKQWLFGYYRFKEYPHLYLTYGADYMKGKATEYGHRLLEHMLLQSGIKDPTVQMKATEMFRARRLPGIVSRYAHNAIFDVGNVDGVINVLKVYSESGGDPDVYEAAVKQQVISSLPVIGQVVSFADADWQGKGMMVLCIAVPHAGIAAMVFNLGENGLVLCEHEYSAPLADAISDTIYRGYVGPSLYEFGQAPQQFTDQDAADLERVKRDAELFRSPKDKNEQTLGARLKTEETRLSQKKSAWLSYVAESSRNEGGKLWGKAAHLKQVRLPGYSLLSQVRPLVFFSPKGPVDFTAEPLNDLCKQRIQELPGLIEAEQDVIAKQDLIGELQGLQERQENAENARKYLDAALENHELMLQIRRDSLWPHILYKDNLHDMVSPRAFVERWVKAGSTNLVARLREIGVEVPDEGIPQRVLDEVANRLSEDTQRSKERYEHWQMIKQAKEKQAEELVEHRKSAFTGEALMEAAEQRSGELSPLAEAIYLRHLPDTPPIVRIGLRVIEGAKPGELEYRPDVRIIANPDIYKQPYHAVTYLLTPQQAAEAAQSRSFMGLPLSDEHVLALKRNTTEANAKGSTAKLNPVVLTFAFCEGFELPQRSVPATIAALPRPQLVNVSIPNGGTKQLYLLGGSVFSGTDALRCEILSAEAVPDGNAFKIECKYQLNKPANVTIYLMDKVKQTETYKQDLIPSEPDKAAAQTDVRTVVFDGIKLNEAGATQTYAIEFRTFSFGTSPSSTTTNILARSKDIEIAGDQRGWVFESVRRVQGAESWSRTSGSATTTVRYSIQGSAVRVHRRTDDSKTKEFSERIEWIGPMPTYVPAHSNAMGWTWVELERSSADTNTNQPRSTIRYDSNKPVLHSHWDGNIGISEARQTNLLYQLRIARTIPATNTPPAELSRRYSVPEIRPRTYREREIPGGWEASLLKVVGSSKLNGPDTAKLVGTVNGGSYGRDTLATFEWTYRKGPSSLAPKPVTPRSEPTTEPLAAETGPAATRSAPASGTTGSAAPNPWQSSVAVATGTAHTEATSGAWQASLNTARAAGTQAAPADPKPPTADEILASPAPWKYPQVQAAMDEWLHSAKPPINDGKAWRYTQWGVFENDAGVTALVPDHTGMTRHEYLWKNCQRLTSARHCTLGDFIRAKLKNGSLDGCQCQSVTAGKPDTRGTQPTGNDKPTNRGIPGGRK